jgi:sulfite reductase alpha subunit-like flavoprotein
VISTTGNGDFPTPSLGFWKFLLRSTLPDDILGDLTYATFGLGDSSYVRYCWSSRKLNKRLRGLGAAELLEAGEADDQHYLGIEGTLRPWMDNLWATLEEVLPPMKAGEKLIGDEVLLPPKISVNIKDTRKEEHIHGVASSSMCPSGWEWARLKKVERMTSEKHWQDVRLIELEDERGREMGYQAGDVVSLMPENSSEDVQLLLNRMGWSEQAESYISLQTDESGQTLPPSLTSMQHFTLRQFLQTYIDFNSVPRPSFFEQLIPFTPPGHMQREKLQEFCTPGDGSDEMYEYAIRVRRTILETLQEFDAVSIPIAYLLDVFPIIQRRDFSIASGPGKYPRSIQLAIALVSYKTRLREMRRGVCSSWLQRLQVGDRVPIKVTKSTTLLSPDPAIPAIFVGPGTGVAPIRSFLQQRDHLLSNGGMKAKDNLCFFGCRNKGKDWLFASEWESMASQSKIDIHLATSRDQDKKIYVQDLIRQNGKKVWDILGLRGGYLYICGSSGKMPQAVREAVVQIVSEHGMKTEQEADEFVTQLELSSRWLEECWS